MESEVIQVLSTIKDSLDALAQPRLIDWLAIMISFLSMIVSGVAVWFAVQVPRKIADRQDKINMFNLRLQTLETVGKMLNQFETLRFYVNMISTECLEAQAKVEIDGIKSVLKSFTSLVSDLGITYQYIFEPKLVNRIRLIIDAINQIYRYSDELQYVVDSIDFESDFVKEAKKIMSQHNHLMNLKKEMKELCELVLSMEKDISIEVGKCMDLRYM